MAGDRVNPQHICPVCLSTNTIVDGSSIILCRNCAYSDVDDYD